MAKRNVDFRRFGAKPDSVRMRRAEDRQRKHAGQSYIIDIARSPREEFAILSSAQRATDIGGRLLGHLGRPSEGLDPGPQLDFQRPGAARLPKYLDISLGDRVGIERAVGTVRGIRCASCRKVADGSSPNRAR